MSDLIIVPSLSTYIAKALSGKKLAISQLRFSQLMTSPAFGRLKLKVERLDNFRRHPKKEAVKHDMQSRSRR